MKKPRNQPTTASFSHGGAAVFGGGVGPVERDELDVAGLCTKDVAGYLRREKNRGRRERERERELVGF